MSSQVVAGWLLGSGSAVAWHAWGRSVVLPRLAGDITAVGCLWLLTAAVCAAFGWQHVRRWVLEHQTYTAKQH